MTAKKRASDRRYCRTCGAEFDSRSGNKQCPKPSPGREYIDVGRGGHIFSLTEKSGAKKRRHRNNKADVGG